MSDEKKIVRFPISRKTRVQNRMGAGYVPCELTMRFLQFDLKSSVQADGEFISLSVMTSRDWDDGPVNPRRLCSLVVTRADLVRALAAVKPRD